MPDRHLCRVLCLTLGLAAALLSAPPARSQAVLNEYLTANRTGVADEDGDLEDWFEIFNPGPLDADLTGYRLTDDPDEPFKWTFPELVLPAGSHLLLFASGKDRSVGAGHWETVIDWGGIWKYRANTTEPPADWRDPGFDDTAWNEGPSGFGFGDGDDSTTVPICVSVYVRKAFEIADPAAIRYICLHVDYDDGFVAYVNGAEIARDNITGTGPPDWDATADLPHEARIYQGGLPETFLVTDPATYLVPGTNVIAVEVHNSSPTNPDLTLIPFLTFGMDAVPPGGSGPAELIRFVLPHLHTNFRLDAEGETLILSTPPGGLADSVSTGQMYMDFARGRSPDGAPDWHFFTEPTPETANGTGGYAAFTEAPAFSPAGGLHASGVLVTLSVPSPEATIYFTLSGGEPTEASIPYAGSIFLSATEVIRARSYEDGHLPSKIVTHTYVIGDPSTLPVVCAVTDPPNLWDEENGIYVFGTDYDPEFPYYGANFWEDWEKPMHFEMYEPDGSVAFRLDAGVKIHGGYTRAYPQKSLRLVARSGYGTGSVDYRVFDEKEIDEFHRLILRNAGNDWCLAHLRDALQHRLAAHTGLGRQAHRPSRLYLNGDYWGIHNIRERIDKYFLESNFDADPDNVDLLKSHYTVMEGDAEHYMAMLDFMETHDLSDSANFAHVETLMDTENYATYYLFRIYFANTDWPGGNTRYWRPREPGGRWQWILQDLDWGLGLEATYEHNTLWFALRPDGPDWPNPPWSTFLMRSLLENEPFKHEFINRYADHLNTSFRPDPTTAMTQEVAALIAAEIPRHMTFWEHAVEIWGQQVDIIEEFLEERPAYARTHIRQYFWLPSELTLSLDISPQGAGSIALTAIEVDSAWSGIYFEGVPITLTALPAPGYLFEEWSDPSLPANATVEILPEGDYAVTAVFVPSPVPDDAIVINEINYNSADDFDPEDWVELHNASDQPVDLSQWVFKDEEDAHEFVIPEGTVLPIGGYLVLCADLAAFTALFPNAEPVLGDLGFGFSGGGELLRLFDNSAALHDWVSYDDQAPWPPEPDGNGPTLELRNPTYDNALPQNWAASDGHGTPCAVNSTYESTDVTEGPDGAWRVDLGRPQPNPLDTRTQIAFSLGRAGKVDLSVYDVSGRRLARLAGGRFDAGVHRLSWQGLDDRGRRLPRGVYLLRLEAGEARLSQKVLIMR